MLALDYKFKICEPGHRLLERETSLSFGFPVHVAELTDPTIATSLEAGSGFWWSPSNGQLSSSAPAGKFLLKRGQLRRRWWRDQNICPSVGDPQARCQPPTRVEFCVSAPKQCVHEQLESMRIP